MTKEEVLQLEKELSFQEFNNHDAYQLGQIIVDHIEKNHLKKLYRLFSLKRNYFSHGSGVVGDTQIINNFSDAKDILNDILDEINESYKIFK